MASFFIYLYRLKNFIENILYTINLQWVKKYEFFDKI